MNIFNLPVLINIHSKNYKKEAQSGKKCTEKYKWFYMLPWVNPSVQFTNSLPFCKYAEFPASAMLSDQN